MYYSDEELSQIFEDNKKIFDRVYLTNKIRYGEEQASTAMYEYFINGRTDFITRSDNARGKMQKFAYHGPEIEQFIIEYAMSSYIANNCNIIPSFDEIRKYANDNDHNLKYDRDTIIAIVALGATWNTCWMSNVIACNSKLKRILIRSLIEERYIDDKKQALDTCKKTKIVKVPGIKPIMISISKLNCDIDNMIRDEEYTYYKDDDNDYQQEYTK